jgi:hypothetical protein
MRRQLRVELVGYILKGRDEMKESWVSLENYLGRFPTFWRGRQTFR